MKILVACEFSGIVRQAFTEKGHNAVSCDLLPSEIPGPHIQVDVKTVLNEKWDMMIAFPPCTHLAVSGARWFKMKKKEQSEAIDFFMCLINAKIPRIAVENPIGIMSRVYRRPDQIIQPWMFGDPFQKSTCLWLKNLPLLTTTNIVYKGAFHVTKSGRKLPEWYNIPPCAERAKIRSRTYKGIASAMANQWC